MHFANTKKTGRRQNINVSCKRPRPWPIGVMSNLGEKKPAFVAQQCQMAQVQVHQRRATPFTKVQVGTSDLTICTGQPPSISRE
ncbi:hypothetical protein GJ744_004229 [Endocarpon pusillum]|uniref:Uncharacterized protein n=1 Tax=Endocarpon pusillum TaxID=364733 RepID=A0A8H7A9Q9_9EURO|nr:hypothetical protein GJ744_004229 [Endocarpon pusillum]